jgi:hypothetical protein
MIKFSNVYIVYRMYDTLLAEQALLQLIFNRRSSCLLMEMREFI